MVNKAQYRKHKGGPPPMEESWWKAVMAEDESCTSGPAETSNPGTSDKDGLNQQSKTDTQQTDWEKASQLFKLDASVSLQVTGYNRGGLLVSGDGLQGFVPLSHIVDLPEGDGDLEGALQGYHDHVLRLKVVECDERRGRVVLSERAALSEPGKRNELLVNLKPCDCVIGVVTNITDFGAFIDLGGVEGLVHVSEISWGRVQHPEDVVSLGDEVEVYVIRVDPERGRVALSLKRLYPNPWESAPGKYYPGQIIQAVITSIVPFGAFAKLEEGLDGLIHISEMCRDAEITHPSELLQEGQLVRVRVLNVDGPKQRLGLSLVLAESTQDTGESTQDTGESTQDTGESAQDTGEHTQESEEHTQDTEQHTREPEEHIQEPEEV